MRDGLGGRSPREGASETSGGSPSLPAEVWTGIPELDRLYVGVEARVLALDNWTTRDPILLALRAFQIGVARLASVTRRQHAVLTFKEAP